MKVIRKILEMQNFSREFRKKGKIIAVVPTMGCLHDGHLSLIDAARKKADIVIVTIFVNPAQFGPNEDFSKYPRSFSRDMKFCKLHNADAIFAPSAGEMYAPDASTWVNEEFLSKGLCGRSRPCHFRGVTTVVAKLFNAVLPDIAVFGRKDYQQAKIVQKMTRDLNFPVKIITAPIIREKDGLAMSSRNIYLTADERRRAVSIIQSLKSAESAVLKGEKDSGKIVKMISMRISQSGGKVDYVETVNADSFLPVRKISGKVLIAAAAFFGKTRLIDNVEISRP